jgi:hypothetical protein
MTVFASGVKTFNSPDEEARNNAKITVASTILSAASDAYAAPQTESGIAKVCVAKPPFFCATKFNTRDNMRLKFDVLRVSKGERKPGLGPKSEEEPSPEP